ncbi:MAG TPA: hypothetical protein VMF87_28640 [Streptosporangiaceae bacterium]|nr:hypothetical protein [Streptosporangiaceae bacterium]
MAGQRFGWTRRAGRMALSGRAGRRAGVVAVAAALIAAVSAAVAAVPAGAGDKPSGFWYGTDSRAVTLNGSAPYSEPVIGGAYGGYIGMTGNWANLENCHKILVWSAANAAKANANFALHQGVGTGVYYFMGGPGVDPHYNGTTTEAYDWGEAQAGRALADAAKQHITYPVMWADIELPGGPSDYTPAPDNGWNSVYTSPCSSVVRISSVPADVDRADFNGFAAYVTAHSSFKVGVYSAPDIWAQIFGTGSSASIPTTYEWTYESFTSSLAHPPVQWCLSGSASSTCARFFGGVTSGSKYALAWQWSGGGGSNNGVGDFDQIDGNRTP